MSNIHVLSQEGTDFTAAFHVAIPASNNTAGLSWRTVVLRVGIGAGVTVLPDGDGTLGTISAAEKASLVSGAIVEIVATRGLNSAFPSGSQLDQIFTDIAAEFTARMQLKYARYGTTR